MARTSADASQLPRPALLTSVGLLARIIPLSTISAVLAAEGKESQRERALPAPFMVYVIVALSLYMPYSLREVLRCVLEGLRALDGRLTIATKGAISRARPRLRRRLAHLRRPAPDWHVTRPAEPLAQRAGDGPCEEPAGEKFLAGGIDKPRERVEFRRK